MLWAICVIIALNSCGNAEGGATRENKDISEAPTEKVKSNAEPATYGTAEMKDTTTLGGHLYTYEMVCQADDAQPLLKNSFGEEKAYLPSSFFINSLISNIVFMVGPPPWFPTP